MSGADVSGAWFQITGSVAANASWNDDIQIWQVGQDTTDLDFTLTLRCSENASPSVSLTTTAGDMSVVTVSGREVLRLAAPAGTLEGLSGNYIIDISSTDASSNVILWGHGTINIKNNPAS